MRQTLLFAFMLAVLSAAGQRIGYVDTQALLKKHPRARAALDTVAKESDWYTPLGPASDGQPRARGVALVRSFSTVVAMVAEVSVSPTGAIRVHRVITAVDVGVAVNPAGVRQQVESAVVYLSLIHI